MKQIVDLHIHEYDDHPQVVVKVPSVYTFVGEFADYCKGFTLCGAGNEHVEVSLSLRADQSVRLYIPSSHDRKRFNGQNLKYRREDRWANYIKGVVSVFNARGFNISGCNVLFFGDLLNTDGSILYSAMALGVALGLKHLYRLHLSDEDCAAIAYTAISSFAQDHCRLAILLAMLQVKPDILLLCDIHHLSFEKISFSPNNSIHFLLVESRISPHALREEFAIRRKESKIAFERLRSTFTSGLLRDISEQEVKELFGVLSEDEKRFCIHVLNESKLAKESSRLLAQNDMVLYGKTLSRVQSSLRDYFEVTCPEIDWLIKRAQETYGCFGSSMITTGSSGTILVILPHESLETYTARMEDYEHIFGFRPSWRSYTPKGELLIDS